MDLSGFARDDATGKRINRSFFSLYCRRINSKPLNLNRMRNLYNRLIASKIMGGGIYAPGK